MSSSSSKSRSGLPLVQEDSEFTDNPFGQGSAAGSTERMIETEVETVNSAA